METKITLLASGHDMGAKNIRVECDVADIAKKMRFLKDCGYRTVETVGK